MAWGGNVCFSAAASFTAAAVAGTVGIATLRDAARSGNPALVPIAAFPILFAAQQMVEGLLWIELARPVPGTCRPALVHAFVAYAEVFWPVFAPLAAWLIEPERWRRRGILICLAIGAVLSCYLLLKMIGNPYAASAATGHIVYKNGATYPKGIEFPYVIATTICLLLSSHRVIQLLALVILVGFGVAYVSFHAAYVSVWCFFAGVTSILVYVFVRQSSKVSLGRQP